MTDIPSSLSLLKKHGLVYPFNRVQKNTDEDKAKPVAVSDGLRKLSTSQLKRTLQMCVVDARALESRVLQFACSDVDMYTRLIRLLLQGLSYEDSTLEVQRDVEVEIVMENEAHKYVVDGETQCPKCKGMRVYKAYQQTRGCDEPTTQFNVCINTKCKHTWKF
jgi:DNA-directed RNA polymerase subunit M/transcription elongation factor TFIIS